MLVNQQAKPWGGRAIWLFAGLHFLKINTYMRFYFQFALIAGARG